MLTIAERNRLKAIVEQAYFSDPKIREQILKLFTDSGRYKGTLGQSKETKALELMRQAGINLN